MELTLRNKTISRLIDEVVHSLSDVASWPESQINREKADRAVKALRKGWKDEGWPNIFLYMTMIYIANNMRCDVQNRNGVSGMKSAWLLLGEVLD